MKPCNSCGKCCLKAGNGGLSASRRDIERWETWRPDIARFAKDGKIWIDPETGKYFARCPWLRISADGSGYNCDIYDDRPDECRHYPIRVADMVRDECEMLDRRDLTDLKRAQRKLDELMSDSRPPATR